MTTSNKIRLAAFDLDGTLIPVQSQKLLVLYLIKRGLLPLKILLYVTRALLCYRFGLRLNYDKEKQRILKFFNGMTYIQAQQLASHFVRQELIPILRGDALDEITRMKKSGVKVLLVSASIEPIVSNLAEMLGADGYIATELDLDNEMLTGKIKGDVVMGVHKHRLFSLYADQNYADWELTYAYGDHPSDIPLLQSARTPVAICPHHHLRTEAQQQGWLCLEWK